MNYDSAAAYVTGYKPVVVEASSGGYRDQVSYGYHDGDKFPGGFGITELLEMDYWQLRARSNQLFFKNLYARGIIRRLLTNEINTGLTPEGVPDEVTIGVEEGSLDVWVEKAERRFKIWSADPLLCCWKSEYTFGECQRVARLESLVAGDILTVLRTNPMTGVPWVQLISGDKVRTPLNPEGLPSSHDIREGVETDARGRVVAHHVVGKDGKSKRMPSRSRRTGRLVSWLVYGTEKRHDEVRGEPLLSIILQSLRDIDRYRDSAQRQAVVVSTIAMMIKRTEDAPTTQPLTGAGAVRRGVSTVSNLDGKPREFDVAEALPGTTVDVLQRGEEPFMIGGKGTDVNFGEFEKAVLGGIAWAYEMPPSVLTLVFSKSHSAAQAEINEFKIYLAKVWAKHGDRFCQPIYVDWLVAEALRGALDNSHAMLAAWRDPMKRDIFGAWTANHWYGVVKPSTDVLKQAKGSELLIKGCLSNSTREARGLTGTSFRENTARIYRENLQKVAAFRPLAEFEREFGHRPGEGAEGHNASVSALEDALTAYLEEAEDERDE